MQNIEQERYSWLKLSIILGWLTLIGTLSVLGSDKNVVINQDDQNLITMMYISQVVLVFILFIAPTVLFAAFGTKTRFRYIGIAVKPAFTTLLIGSIGILVAQPIINWLADLNEHMHLPAAFCGIETWMKESEARASELTDIFTKGTSVGGLLLNLFVVAFMAALSEELFFRGMLQKVLIDCFKNKHVGVWIAAIFFSALHMQFFGFIPRMLMGVYLGYLFVWSGSLWPGMIAHFVNNAVAVFLVWLSNRGVISEDVWKIGTEGNQLIFVLASAVMVAASLFLVYRFEKKRKIIVQPQ